MAASFPDPAQPLHVVFASTAAGTLQRALDALHRRDAIVCLADDLSIGPIDGAGSRAAWLQSSHDLESAKRIADNRVVVVETSNANRISPVVWMSSVDARSYAGFLWWLAQVGCGSAPKRDPALMRRRRLKLLQKVIFFVVRSAPVGTPLSLGFQNSWRCLARKSWGPASAPIHIQRGLLRHYPY